MLHQGIVMRSKGTIHGSGLFATQHIPKGTPVWTLNEPTFSWEEVKSWSKERLEAFNWYGFQCGVDLYSLPEGLSRETNHSCDPSTWWAGSNVLVARREIHVGEEITYDYATCDVDLIFKMGCHCGALNCRGKISNRDYLNPDWQKQYGSNLPPHVLAAIEKDT